MQQSRIFALSLALVGTAFSGCEKQKTDPVAPPVRGPADAGTANLDAQGGIDGGDGDLFNDAGMTMKGTARVILQDDGHGLPGINVMLSDNEGTYLSHHQTGTDGILEVEIEPNTTVTIMARFEEGGSGEWHKFRQTYVGINPGDVIRFGEENSRGESTLVGTATITYTVPTLGVDPDEILIAYGCGTSTATAVMPGQSSHYVADIYSDCVAADNTISFIVMARSGDRILAYATATDLSINDVVSSSSAISIVNWRMDFSDYKVKVTNPRSKAIGSSAEATLLRKGKEFEGGEKFSLLTPLGAEIDLQLAEGFGQGIKTQVITIYGGGFGQPPEAVTMFVTSSPMMIPAELSVDMMTDVVPPMYETSLDQTTAPRWTLKWRIEDGNSIADVLFGVIEWHDAGEKNTWGIYMPGDRQGPWRLPEMPDRFAQFRATTNEPMIPFQWILIGADFIDGYADFIENYGPELFDSEPPANARISASFGGGQF